MKQKKLLSLLTILMVAGFLFSCKKNSDGGPVNLPALPALTDRGTLQGTPTSKQIGPAGGQLTSADGRISISVAPGTVGATTNFTIQPITNEIDASSTRPAYRLSPEGVHFAKPVDITFHYKDEEIRNTVEDGLMIAYQTSARYWKAIPASRNRTANTITVSSTHFSDWVIVSSLEIHIEKPLLAPGEWTELSIKGFMPTDDDTLLAPLFTKDAIRGGINTIGNWRIITGPGELNGTDGTATYRAPTSNTGVTKVEVQVELGGNMWVPDKNAPDGELHLSQVILLGSLSIAGETYMVGSFGGTDIMTTEVTALFSNGKVYITGHTPTGSYGIQLNGAGVNDYPCGDQMIPGNSFVNATFAGNPTGTFSFGSTYETCGPPPAPQYSDGVVSLSEWGAIGEPVSGSFTGLLYQADGPCEWDKKQLNIEFRTIRVL